MEQWQEGSPFSLGLKMIIGWWCVRAGWSRGDIYSSGPAKEWPLGCRCLFCSPVRATYATLKAAPPSSAQILYDAIIVSHDNMHLITGLYVISEPIHSSNVIRIITGWLHWQDDLTAAILQREGGVREMMKAHLIWEPIPYDEETNVSSSQW